MKIKCTKVNPRQRITASSTIKWWMAKYTTPDNIVKKVYFEGPSAISRAEKQFKEWIPEPYTKAIFLGSVPNVSDESMRKEGFTKVSINSSTGHRVTASEEVDPEIKELINNMKADGVDLKDKREVLQDLGANYGYDRGDQQAIWREISRVIRKGIYGAEDTETSEEDEELETADQEFTSKDTSINSSKLPAIYSLVKFPKGATVLDYGGGKFDNGIAFIEEQGAKGYVYDPFNRTDEYNRQTLSAIRKNGGADIVLCSNVLNVIQEEKARMALLRNIKKLVKSSGKVYITVYEGKGNGQGKQSQKDSYQLNRKTADYLEEIQQVFPDATRKGKLIIATPNGVAASTNINASESNLRSRIYDFLDEMGGYADYNQKIEDVSEEFGMSPDEAEGYVCDWIQNAGAEWHDTADIESAQEIKPYSSDDNMMMFYVGPGYPSHKQIRDYAKSKGHKYIYWGSDESSRMKGMYNGDTLVTYIDPDAMKGGYRQDAEMFGEPIEASKSIKSSYVTRHINYCPHCANMTLTEVGDGLYVCDECGEEYEGYPAFNGGLHLKPIEGSTTNSNTIVSNTNSVSWESYFNSELGRKEHVIHCDNGTGFIREIYSDDDNWGCHAQVDTNTGRKYDKSFYREGCLEKAKKFCENKLGISVTSNTNIQSSMAPYQQNELVKQLQDEIKNKMSEVLQSEVFGFPLNEIADYFVVDVELEDDELYGRRIKVEVRGELDYEGMSMLADALNPIVAKYDKDAYFDHVTGGIIAAYIYEGITASSDIMSSVVPNQDINQVMLRAVDVQDSSELMQVLGDLLNIDKELYQHYCDLEQSGEYSPAAIGKMISDELYWKLDSTNVDSSKNITAADDINYDDPIEITKEYEVMFDNNVVVEDNTCYFPDEEEFNDLEDDEYNITVDDGDGVAEKILDMLLVNLPEINGTYRVSGIAHLRYIIDGIYNIVEAPSDPDDVLPDSYYDTQFAESRYDDHSSYIENLQVDVE